jgi:uncharacterized membrane protein YfcA
LKICQLGKDLLQETPDDLPMEELTMPLRLVCVGFGGLLGSWIGALHLNPRTLRLLLALLLLTAAARMITASF